MKLNKKTFLLSYFILISVIIFFVIITSILGNINRKSYITNFKNIVENKYSFTLKYKSNIFKNNKIYKVQPNTNQIIENIISIKFNDGSSFGTLITDEKLDINSKIENIEYKLKLRKEVFIFFILIIIIFPIIYSYVIPNIINNYKIYILLLIIHTLLYFSITKLILPFIFNAKIADKYL